MPLHHSLARIQAEVEQWIPHRTEFLHELLRLEAPPPKNPACATCKSSGEYRCLGCFTGDAGELVCKGCLLSRHANNPFHEVQVCFLVFVTSRLMSTFLRYGTDSSSRTPPSLPPASLYRFHTTPGVCVPPPAFETSRCSIYLVPTASLSATAIVPAPL